MSWFPHRISRSSQERARAEEAQYTHLPRQLLSYALPELTVEQQSTTDTSTVLHNPMQAPQLSVDNTLQSGVYFPAGALYQIQQATSEWPAPPDGRGYGVWYASTSSRLLCTHIQF